jgi:tRNA nucleotidyltransferase (CCA-adding enzyme)
MLERLQTAPGADVVLAAVGDEPGVHVVGGAVRDVLLDRTPRELDLVVEGDAVAVARRAARRVGGELTVHERFGTATVRADGYEFDLAAARTESYARPGALPDVRLGATIAEDLARRDFSVNAIAVALTDGRVTEWVAPGGGEAAGPAAREDLAAGVLRVLHDRSFADDPTRMLRMVRYAHRLGFGPEPHTGSLVDPALLGTVSGDRLGAELRLIVAEHALPALGELGPALLPGFAVPAALPRDPLAALAACCTEVSGLAARLDDLGFTAKDRKLVVAAAHAAPRLRLAGAGEADIWRALHKLPPQAAEIVAAGDGPDAEAAQRWLDDLRHRALSITGDDLVAAGLQGPAVGKGLEAAMVALLEGRAPDRDAQLAAAIGN